MNMNTTVTINVQETKEFDVVVVGGGTTGVCAALASARKGVRTAIVETSGFFGGTASCGLPWMGFHNYEENRFVVGGLPMEIIHRLKDLGGASEFQMDPILESTIFVDTTLLKIVLMQMLREAGVHMFLHTLAGEVEQQGDTITGLYLHSKQGCHLIKTKMVIDCTDSADIALRAGCEVIFGRPDDHKVQVASTIFVIGNVDIEKMISYFEANPTQLRPHKLPPEELTFVIQALKTAPLFSLGAFKDLIQQATQNGSRFPRETMIGIVRPARKEVMLVTPRIMDVNPNVVESFTNGENEGYEQILDIMKFIHDYMPGGENAYIVSSGHTIGMRETNHVIGEYILTQEDLVNGTPFSDAIACGAYYMDNHTPDTKGLAPMIQPPTYQIPYRALLPKGCTNLLMAGRCISATHEALAATRVIPIAAAEGQAAGTAAATAILNMRTLRELDIAELQTQLIYDDVILR